MIGGGNTYHQGTFPDSVNDSQRGTERTLNADAIRQSGTHLKHRPSPLSHGRYLAPSDTDPSIRPARSANS